MDSVTSAALTYINRGWVPVPLYGMTDGTCRCGGGCGKSAGKHPVYARWQDRDWRGWDGWAHHAGNVGIVTGRISGFWVLDYDPASAGQDAHDLFSRLVADGRLPHVETGGAGKHWRFAMPDFPVTNARGRLPRGLDVRGDGGQVVAPPSVSGKGPYVELRTGVDVAPAWLLDLIRPLSLDANEVPAASAAGQAWSDPPSLAAGSDRAQRYAIAALRGECETYAALDDGRRGEAAWRLACRAVELMNLGRFRESDVVGMWLGAVGAARGNAPGGLTEMEALRTWQRACREVGDRAAEMGPDPLTGESMPPEYAAPFSQASQVGAYPEIVTLTPTLTPLPTSAFPMPTMTDAGSAGTASPDPTAGAGGTPATDPFENAVRVEAWKLAVREEARRRHDAARAGARPPIELEFIEADKLDTIASLAELVPGVLLLDSLARVNGRPGQGKSFVVADLACSVASGTAWAGRPVKRGPVLAVVAEGVSGFRDRIRAWERDRGVTLSPAEFAILPRAPLVGGPEWPDFVAAVARRRPVLVTLDTQARAAVGLRENDATDMGLFVDGLETLRTVTGACVLVVHHASKDGDAGRGSNAVEGAMSSEFGVSRVGGTVTVRTTKQKDLEQGPPLTFDLKTVAMTRDLGGGMSEPALPSAVLVHRDPRVGAAEGAPVDIGKARQRALWAVMHDRLDGGEGGTRAEIRALFRDSVIMRDVKPDVFRSAWAAAWGGLIRLGLVAKRGERFRIVVVTNQSEDGVLTPNPDIERGGVGTLGPTWTLWTPGDDKSG